MRTEVLLVLLSIPLFLSISVQNPLEEKIATIPVDSASGIPFVQDVEPVMPGFIQFLDRGKFIVHDRSGLTIRVFDSNFRKENEYSTLGNQVVIGGSWIVSYGLYGSDVPFAFGVQDAITGTVLGTWKGTNIEPALSVSPPYILGYFGRGKIGLWAVNQSQKTISYFDKNSLAVLEKNVNKKIVQVVEDQPGVFSVVFADRLVNQDLYTNLVHRGQPVSVPLEEGGTVSPSGKFFALDSEGNSYFYDRLYITILNQEGAILRYLRLGARPTSSLCIDSFGNIHFIRSSEEGHNLFRIRRTW